jgi:hypothetical protein
MADLLVDGVEEGVRDAGHARVAVGAKRTTKR